MATPASPSPSDQVMKWIDQKFPNSNSDNITIRHRDLDHLAKIVGIKGKYGWFSRHTVRQDTLKRVQEIVRQWQENHIEQILSSSENKEDFTRSVQVLDRLQLKATDEGRLTVTLGEVSDTEGKIVRIAEVRGLNLDVNISAQSKIREKFNATIQHLSEKLHKTSNELFRVIHFDSPQLLNMDNQLDKDYIEGRLDFLQDPNIQRLFLLAGIREFLDGLGQQDGLDKNALDDTLKNFEEQMVARGLDRNSAIIDRSSPSAILVIADDLFKRINKARRDHNISYQRPSNPF